MKILITLFLFLSCNERKSQLEKEIDTWYEQLPLVENHDDCPEPDNWINLGEDLLREHAPIHLTKEKLTLIENLKKDIKKLRKSNDPVTNANSLILLYRKYESYLPGGSHHHDVRVIQEAIDVGLLDKGDVISSMYFSNEELIELGYLQGWSSLVHGWCFASYCGTQPFSYKNEKLLGGKVVAGKTWDDLIIVCPDPRFE